MLKNYFGVKVRDIMLIKTIITTAKFSELSGVAIKDNVEAIVAFMNLGMIELYKRFPIKVSEHILDLEDGVMFYEMPKNFMYAIEAYGEVDKTSAEKTRKIAINDEDADVSIFFNDWNTIQVPSAVTGYSMSIIYVPTPADVTVEEAEDGVSELDLPSALVDALLSYIGYRAYLGVKSDSQSENNAHWARFERMCKKAEDLGVAFPSDSMSTSNKATSRGFI